MAEEDLESTESLLKDEKSEVRLSQASISTDLERAEAGGGLLEPGLLA